MRLSSGSKLEAMLKKLDLEQAPLRKLHAVLEDWREHSVELHTGTYRANHCYTSALPPLKTTSHGATEGPNAPDRCGKPQG